MQREKSLLRAARERSGQTQEQVAKGANVNTRLYQNYEYDKIEPAIRTAIRIADTLGIQDLRELWGGNPTR